MVTTVIALSICVLVFVAACVALCALVFATFRQIGRLETERDALAKQARSAKDELADKVSTLEASRATCNQLAKQRDYNSDQVAAWKKRADDLTEWGRVVLMVSDLGSETDEGDPLEIGKSALEASLAGAYANSQRLLDVCAVVGGTPDDVCSRIKIAQDNWNAAGKFIEAVEARVGVTVRSAPMATRYQLAIEGVDQQAALLSEKTGKLNHYRVAIDDALGGVRGENERWSQAHVSAILKLREKLDAAVQMVDLLTESRTRICTALGISPDSAVAEDGRSYVELVEALVVGSTAELDEVAQVLDCKPAEVMDVLKDRIDVLKHRNRALKAIAVAVGEPNLVTVSDDYLRASWDMANLLSRIEGTRNALDDAKRELAEAEEAGSEALEKAVAAEELRAARNAPSPWRTGSGW